LMLMYPLIMIIFGVVALLNKSIAAKYFLVGSIFAAIGSSITALAVLGVIPFNVITYRAVEIGMLIDIILLALALAELFRDINNKKIFAENMALKDPLTSIGNRRSVYNKVNNIWMENNENKENIAIIMLDIDRFKLINDTYGHSFGDEVIIKIAEIIKQNARSKDIFARWGGEEFIMILPSIFGLDTKIFTERISKIIENTLFHVDGEIEKITVSCGIAILDDEKTIDELISSADTQLYNAKKRGRNCVCSTNDFKPLMAI
ncbi:MAG: diguanylate cyclase (GGDEF)-like protein, partial [Paraglaciecola sp.]